MKRFLGVVLVVLAFSVPAAGAPPTPDQLRQQQFALAGVRAVKILVDKEGWHRVRFKDLRAAGFPVGAKTPPMLQLYADGVQVPILIRRGVFEFYGRGLDTDSTDTRVYWLVAGKTRGLRVSTVRAGVRARNVTGGSFPATVVLKLRTGYSAPILNGPESNVFGPPIRPGGPLTVKVSAPRAAASAPATLRVTVHGFSKVAHVVRVALNGDTLGNISFRGQAEATATYQLPAGAIKDGENALVLSTHGGEIDFALTRSVELTYGRTYLADQDTVTVPVRGGQTLTIGGFSSKRIRVFDVSRADRMRELLGTVSGVAPDARVSLHVPAGASRLLAVADSKVVTPALVRNAPSALNAATHAADLLIVSHADFLRAVRPLAELRARQGFKVEVVDVADVFDEFSFGARDPQALKQFFMWAKQRWQTAPRYVLLVGDASNDPRNFAGEGSFEFVPTTFKDTQYMESPSDDSLADFDDDGVPEMAVGRLPVRSEAQATTVVAKIIGYERTTRPRSVLLVADKNIDYDFEAHSKTLWDLIPGSIAVSTVYRREGPTDAAVRSRLVAALNQGPTIVNFFGHGAIQIWTSGSILRNADAANLTNQNALSLYLMMTCLNGYFVHPTYGSLGEALLFAPNGGAVATWASSGETVPADQVRADQEAVRLLLSDPMMTLGDAMVRGKRVISDIDVRHTWILLGDPTTRLR